MRAGNIFFLGKEMETKQYCFFFVFFFPSKIHLTKTSNKKSNKNHEIGKYKCWQLAC